MESDLDLLHGNNKELAAFLGCTVRMVQLYKKGRPLPVAFRKLLALRFGDLSALMGKDWEGFSFGRDGLLYLPTYRNGFDAHQIRGMFFTVQEVVALRNELKALKAQNWARDKVKSLWTLPPRKITS